jgi:hypothetical protein
VCLHTDKPKPLAAPSDAFFCDRMLAGIAGSKCRLGLVCLRLASGVCHKVYIYVPVMDRSLFQRIRTECAVSDCDFETSTTRRSRPLGPPGVEKMHAYVSMYVYMYVRNVYIVYTIGNKENSKQSQ